MKALNVSSVRQMLGDLLPIFSSIVSDQFSELLVFLLVPVSFVILRIGWV